MYIDNISNDHLYDGAYEPYLQKPHISTKKPHISTIEPCISTKKPFISAKVTYLSIPIHAQ